MLVALALVGIALVVLFVAALVSVVRSDNYRAGGKAVWILLVLAFPFLGPVVWFVWGKDSTFQ
ncbi:hypothetical protein HCA44_16235 [Rhodococcus sp. HNM0569]|nr:PLDc N-terminal domain-containing protein [Rhodococcus sp. HNM0569]NLU84324.1 hypothetical protein [Rhodococcus sp. HNM0569]